jgi:gamma-glutamylcyclotransferase (GGCT)/AIG2-like uncharacterized protein YtfP
MKKNAKVFVYGTLRKHQINHYLLNQAIYLGLYTTRPLYKMFHLGGYPGVVKGGGTSITGEVYQVDALTMHNLDRLEGYPSSYSRALIPSPWGLVWIYLYRGSVVGRTVIPNGIWRDKINWRRWSR